MPRPSATSTSRPEGIVVAPAGDYYVADAGLQQIVHHTTDDKDVVVAGTGTAAYDGDGIAALGSQVSSPHAIRRDGDGNLYFVERHPALAGVDTLDQDGRADNLCVADDQPLSRVRRIGTDGKISTVYTASHQLILDLCATPGDFLFMALWDPCGGKGSVVMIPPGADPVPLIGQDMGYRLITSLCFDNDKNLYASTDDRLLEYTDNALASVVLASQISLPTTPQDQAQVMVVGGGQLYFAERSSNRIVRYTPFVGKVEAVAGPGTLHDDVKAPAYLTFAPDGSLYFVDGGTHQVRHLTVFDLLLAVTI